MVMVDDPRQRLRGNFAEVLNQQISELDLLAEEATRDPDVADALVFELERVRGTALALTVEAVAEAASRAIEEIRAGAPVEAVARFGAACRGVEESALGVLNPVVLVGVGLPRTNAYAWMVRLAADVDGALARRGGAAAYVVRADLAPQLAARLRRLASPVPFFVVGARHDFQGRLAAARLGAAGFLSEPLDLGALVSRVRLTDDAQELAPARVLLIHPDREAGEALRGALAGPDLTVHRVADGLHVLVALDSLWPDLVVLPVQAGSVRARDVIAVVRGHPQFAELPMLLLVGEAEAEGREALGVADELLYTGLLDAPALRGRVRAWARRVAVMRSNQELDLATGARSQSALLRALDREIGLARRGETCMALAVLDVDGLGNVNAALGAPVGDQVLRALAERASAALRQTDVVGRLGADSFALLLPGCSAEDAARRVEELRARFSDWVAGQGLVDVAFSAGIVDTRAGFHDVLARANRALQGARAAGGGRSAVAT